MFCKLTNWMKPLLELIIWPQKTQQGLKAAGREKTGEEKMNKSIWEEPPPTQIYFHVDLQNTHVPATLSSRFNHVGVIAVKKHSTEKAREAGKGKREEHVNISFCCFIHHYMQ